MTDKEKLTALRAEIERRISSINNREHKIPADKVAVIQLEAVLSLYDSLQEEPVDYDKLNTMLDDALSKETKENWNERLDKKEPVSEDLEEAATSFARKDSEGISNPANFYYTVADKARIFKAGAKWKEDQLEKNRLAACDAQTEEEAGIERDFVMSIIEKEHRQPTFDDAIKYGMRLQREDMIKEAVNGLVYAQSTNGGVMFRSNYVKKKKGLGLVIK